MRFPRYGRMVIAAVVLLIGAAVLASFLYPRMRRVDYVNEREVLQRPLMIPPLLEPHVDGDEKVFRLKVLRGQTALLPGKLTATVGFNGTFLGRRISEVQDSRTTIASEFDADRHPASDPERASAP